MRLENIFNFADFCFTSNVSNLFLGHDFFFRLLVCKTFLVMMMFLLRVDLKNSVMPKMTLSWITVVRQFIDHLCNPEMEAWDSHLVHVKWSGVLKKDGIGSTLFELMKVENNLKVFT